VPLLVEGLAEQDREFRVQAWNGGDGAGERVLGFVAPAGVAAVLAGIGVITAAVAQVASWFRRSPRSSTANCSS
jgi:hypothetical protein